MFEEGVSRSYRRAMGPSGSRSRNWARAWHVLLFFVIAPFIVAFVTTSLQLAMVVNGNFVAMLGVALLFTIPGTLFAWAITSLIARLPKAEVLPLPLLLVAGYFVSLLIFRPYNRFVYDLIPTAAPQVQVITTSLGQEVLRFLLVNVPGVIIWIGLNALFIARLEFPVYGRPRNTAIVQTEASAQVPHFLHAAGVLALSDLWVISAEEHYLRLHGAFGTRLIRHSFSAAVAQLPVEAGLRVHRSHWVAFGKVARIEGGRTPRLLLHDGTLVPVSGAYHKAVLLTEARLLSN